MIIPLLIPIVSVFDSTNDAIALKFCPFYTVFIKIALHFFVPDAEVPDAEPPDAEIPDATVAPEPIEPGPRPCIPHVEICNGVDDDCDDIVDEVPPEACSGGGMSYCIAG
jgi:hypothetical protein